MTAGNWHFGVAAGVQLSSDNVSEVIACHRGLGGLSPSAGHMENGIGRLDVLIQELHGFLRWDDEQFHSAPLSLTFDLIHDR